MILFIIKSSLCLALFISIYYLFLEKEKMHQFNRFYLLGSLLTALVAPNLVITTSTPEIIEPLLLSLSEISSNSLNYSETIAVESVTAMNSNVPISKLDYTKLIWFIYLLIALILAIRFTRNLTSLIRKTKSNDVLKFKSAKLVLVEQDITSHTFINFIFLNKTAYLNGNIDDEVLTHELTHVNQIHTLDIILIELLQILFWFNPLFLIYNKMIKLNHEYIADEEVVKEHNNPIFYQELLFQSSTVQSSQFISHFNFLVVKKRLNMMVSKRNNIRIYIKKFSIIPVIISIVLIFSEKGIAKNDISYSFASNFTISQDSLAIYKDLFYSGAKYEYIDNNGDIITKYYDELTNKQKEIFSPPPNRITTFIRNSPTKEEYESWKNKEYHLFIDDFPYSYKELNKYRHTDFFHFGIVMHSKDEIFYNGHNVQLWTEKYWKERVWHSKTNLTKFLIAKENNDKLGMRNIGFGITIKEDESELINYYQKLLVSYKAKILTYNSNPTDSGRKELKEKEHRISVFYNHFQYSTKWANKIEKYPSQR